MGAVVSPPAAATPDSLRVWLLARSLSVASAAPIVETSNALKQALVTGGEPFELICGAPVGRYGARIGVQPLRGREAELARGFDLDGHPWGVPDWIGLRIDREGRRTVKPYHRAARTPRSAWLPGIVGLPGRFVPVMAALLSGEREIYAWLDEEQPWERFAAGALRLLGGTAPAMRFAPRPRPARLAFGVGLRLAPSGVRAVTLYAAARALPDEPRLTREWLEGLAPEDARAHEVLVAAARAQGRLRSGATHAILAWTREASGEEHRAASLALPCAVR